MRPDYCCLNNEKKYSWGVSGRTAQETKSSNCRGAIALGQDARKYDSKDGIGRVESGTETESNA
jgi:hypothetical protein